MKPSVRRLINVLLVLVPILIVLVVAFSTTELGNAWDALETLDPIWLLAALACWFGHIFFNALGTYYFVKGQKKPLTLKQALYASTIGFYYSYITPGATGGQPMQVYTMKKYDVPVAVGTSAVTTKFICTQSAISLLALGLFLTNRPFIYEQLAGAIWIVRIGWVINAAVIPLAILAAFRRNMIRSLVTFFIRLGAKLHLVKKPEDSVENSLKMLDGFYACFTRLMKQPINMVIQLLIAVLEMLSLLCITLCVYKAFGPQVVGEKNPTMLQLLTMASLLYVSASYTPLPGASGANEGGFLLYFQDMFSGSTIRMALLVWRFFSYYMFLITGMFMSLLSPLIGRKKHKQDKAEKRRSIAQQTEEAIARAKAVAEAEQAENAE